MAINPIDHPIMFEIPRFKAPSEWIEHAPFGMLLVDLVRPRSIVELGVRTGLSYCTFCQAVEQLKIFASCYGVGGGQLDDEMPDVLQKYHDQQYGAFSRLIWSTFDDAAAMFSDGYVDLLHIDGYHTYEAVSHDFSTWLPKMTDRGIVLLNNITERHVGYGVWRFWEEMTQRYPSFQLLHCHGLGVICVGSMPPEGLQQLLDCSAVQKDTLRTLCQERGSQLRARQRIAIEGKDSTLNTRDGISKMQEDITAIKAYIEHSEQEKRALPTTSQEHTIELLRVRERQALETELRARTSYESQISALQDRTRELASRLNDLTWIESSRGVKAIKLVRATRYLLKQRGPVHAVRRVLMWVSGKRGIGIPATAQNTATLRSTTASDNVSRSPNLLVSAVIRDQQLPASEHFSGVTIIVPVFNALEFAQKCVASMYDAVSQVPFEIIVIDNGSDENVLSWLRSESRQRDNLWYVSVSSNLGYARGVNLGIKQARGQYIVLASSDILVTSHWLDSLVAIMASQPDIGVLSPLTNRVGHGPQRDPLAVNMQPEDRELYAAKIAPSAEVEVVTTPLIFFCVMVRKQVASLLGGLDEGYALGNFEDDDFCMRARSGGYKLAVAKNTFVYHFGMKTFAANHIDHNSSMYRNTLRYLDMMSSMSSVLQPRTPRRTVTEPTISVIVRTVDRPQTLRLALTSLANQTLDSFEVVVVCDAGPDIQYLLADYAPFLSIRYVHNAEPKGRSEALNVGVAHAAGHYIAYLDDDDIVYPTHLETLLNTATEGEEGTTCAYVDYSRALVTAVAGEITTVSRVPVASWDFNYDQLLVSNFLPIHTWLHDRKAWEEVGGFATEMDMMEDWDFLIRLAERRNFIGAKRFTCEYRFYMSRTDGLITNRSRTLAAMQTIYLRYPGGQAVEAQRTDLLLAIREQVASGKHIVDSLDGEGQISEPLMRQLLEDIAGFVF